MACSSTLRTCPPPKKAALAKSTKVPSGTSFLVGRRRVQADRDGLPADADVRALLALPRGLRQGGGQEVQGGGAEEEEGGAEEEEGAGG